MPQHHRPRPHTVPGRLLVTDLFTETLANRVHQLEQRNRTLATRVRTLERTRDQQRARLARLYYQLHLHRARVRCARQSRDMWRHRAMIREDG